MFARVIAVVGEPLPASVDIHLNSLEEAFKKMVSGEPVEKFPGSGIMVADVGPPNLILLDVGSSKQFSHITTN